MINTVSELLEKLRKKEKAFLDSQKIVHAPTIGKMYEGLTKHIGALAIPNDIRLDVKSGFIRSKDNKLSKQIDVMIVYGETEQVPYTDDVIVNIENVIAVIETKKSLFSKELVDGYDNIASVNALNADRAFPTNFISEPWNTVTGRIFKNVQDFNELNPVDKILHGYFVKEILRPIRIIIGYDGYSSEYHLRKAYLSLLNKNHFVSGYGPASFPNLVIANDVSLVKLNGMPYALRRDDNLLSIMASYKEKPLKIFLELLWTRLVYLFNLNDYIFGEDLIYENLSLLLSGIPQKHENGWGWQMEIHNVSSKDLKNRPSDLYWQPVTIDVEMSAIFILIGKYGKVNINEPDFIDFLSRNQLDKDIFLKKLLNTGFLTIEDSHLCYVSKKCVLAYLPDGKILAADDISGRFTRWVSKQQIPRN